MTQGFHSWLELGLIREWLKRLDEVKAMSPDFVHTGRGGSGDTNLIENEIIYLKTVASVFEKYKKSPKQKPTDELSERILHEIEKKYPSYYYTKFIENGIEAMWNNQ